MKTEHNRILPKTWIDVFDPICVARWTSRLGLSESELRSTVRTIGGDAEKVEAFVRRQNMFPATSQN